FRTSFKPFRELPPWTDRVMTTTAAFRFTLTATHRVIDRVHHHAAHVRASPLPTRTTRFTAGNVHVIDVSDLADRRETILVNPTHFARRHLHQRETAFQVVQNRLLARAARNLTAAPWTQFDVVNVCAERNCPQRQRIAELRRDIIAGDNFRADLQPVWREDVTHLAVGVFNKSYSRRAVRVVLDSDYFRGDAVLAAFEIDFAVMLFVSAADVARSHSAVIVAATGFFLRLEQALRRSPLCDFVEGRRLFKTLDRRERAITFERHKIKPVRSSRPPRASRSLSSNARAGRAVRGHASVYRRNCRCLHRPLSFGTNAAPRL